jgi:hypothetical protein
MPPRLGEEDATAIDVYLHFLKPQRRPAWAESMANVPAVRVCYRYLACVRAAHLPAVSVKTELEGDAVERHPLGGGQRDRCDHTQ